MCVPQGEYSLVFEMRYTPENPLVQNMLSIDSVDILGPCSNTDGVVSNKMSHSGKITSVFKIKTHFDLMKF